MDKDSITYEYCLPWPEDVPFQGPEFCCSTCGCRLCIDSPEPDTTLLCSACVASIPCDWDGELPVGEMLKIYQENPDQFSVTLLAGLRAARACPDPDVARLYLASRAGDQEYTDVMVAMEAALKVLQNYDAKQN